MGRVHLSPETQQMGSWGLRWQTESTGLSEGLVFSLLGRVEKDAGELVTWPYKQICDSRWIWSTLAVPVCLFL